MIRLSFHGYPCESGVPLFKHEGSWQQSFKRYKIFIDWRIDQININPTYSENKYQKKSEHLWKIWFFISLYLCNLLHLNHSLLFLFKCFWELHSSFLILWYRMQYNRLYNNIYAYNLFLCFWYFDYCTTSGENLTVENCNL